MSDNLGPADPTGNPEYLDARSGEPLAEQSPMPGARGKKRGLIAAVAVLGVGAVGAGAWAATSYFANGAQPVEALPASTLGYVSIDVEPSGEQMIEAYQFLKKFPAMDEMGLGPDTDLREKLFEEIQADGACPDLDYAADVEPWLGTSAAMAAVPDGDQINPVAVVQIEDGEAAEAGMKKLLACGEDDDQGGWALSGDWAVIAEDAAIAEDVVAQAEKATLADDADHARWLDEVGDLGVMTAYVAPDALERVMELAAETDPDMAEMLSAQAESYEDFAGMAMTLRFRDEGLELVAAADASIDGLEVGGTQAGDSVAALPADTAAALGFSVGDNYAEKLLEQLTTYAGAGDVDEMVSELETQLGIDLPADLQTLLGESVVLAVSGDLDIDQVANSADGSDVPVGVKITGNAGDIESVIDQLRPAAGPLGDTILATDSSEEAVAIGPNADYRAQLLKAGSLGDGDTFADVVGDSGNSTAILYLDFAAADNWLSALAEQSGDQDLADNLAPLTALGVNAEVEDEVAQFTVRLAAE